MSFDDTDQFLLDQLKTGAYLRGDSLGEALGVSRVAVSKRMKQLRKRGVPIESAAGKGYCLAAGAVLLDACRVLSFLDASQAEQLLGIEVHAQLNSTNLRAAEMVAKPAQANLVLAESQLAGKGRRDRQWISTPWRNLMWSLSWRFQRWPADLPATSLLAAVVTAQALEIAGVEGVQIKWPNDIYLQGKKLGGLLVNAKGDANGDCDLVVGIGINHYLDPADGKLVDQAWTDLHSCGYQIDRNRLAAILLQGFLEYLPVFETQGFAPFVDAWNQRALYRNQKVRCVFSGAAEGVDSYLCLGADIDGSLILEKNGQITRLRDAECSLRPA